MVLVDTSVWVDYLNNGQHPSALVLEELLKAYDVAICPPIYREVLQGIKNDKDFVRIKSILLNLHLVQHNPYEVAESAASLYREMRKKGVTIKSTADVVIAMYAIKSSAAILTLDSDFLIIAKISPLEIYVW